MNPARWAEVKSILGQVLDTDPDLRTTTLDKLCGSDDALKREVESLLALEAKADAALETKAAPGAILRADLEAPPPPASIGPYRVLCEIGRGGMGVVYLGERADGQYQKQVAIKLITSGRRDLGLDGRFRRERQILAQFEHPGIARMLDGGATPEGQPYFVMEYVEGLPLLAYCDQHQLGVPERIELFLSVCDAVAHAHQRLVVHRDLKPGNILVTKDGHPKLLDFGLARVLDADEDANQTVPMMTPAYASPEQIRGELYTVSGDVYSLGIILYELLSSKRPYNVPSGSLAEMVRTVCEQEPPKLSDAIDDERLRKRVRGDLETIAAKALEKDPRERYASVVELSQDLRRYLDGLPVKARPATFFYRSGKWIRRHGIAVTVGALAAALILAFAGVAWVEARNAQRRFDEVRSLAHSVIFDLHDAIAPLPGSTAARNLLIARALEYLERLSKDAGNDPKLAWEVALAYERIGIVQGFAPESNLGNGAAALESFKKSVAILSKLSASASYTRQLQRDYIRVLNHLAFSYGHNADYQSERETAQKCVAIAEGFLASHPGDPLAIADLANGLGTLADSLTDQKQYAEAALLRERVLALTLENEKAQPANPERRRNLALAYKKLAALYGVLHRYEDSRRSYEEARKIDEARLQAHPGDRAASMDLSFDYSDLGWVSSRLEDEPAALESHLKALELRQQAAKSDPNDARAASAVATSTSRIANTYQRLGDLDRAMDWFKRAIALRTAARDSRASDPGASSELARARQDLGELYEEMAQKKHRPEALASAASEYAQALSLYSDLRARGKLAKVDSEKIDELSGQLALVRAAR